MKKLKKALFFVILLSGILIQTNNGVKAEEKNYFFDECKNDPKAHCNDYTVNYIDVDTKEKIIPSDVYNLRVGFLRYLGYDKNGNAVTSKDNLSKLVADYLVKPFNISGYKYITFANTGTNVSIELNKRFDVNFMYKKVSDETPKKGEAILAKLLVRGIDIETQEIIFETSGNNADGSNGDLKHQLADSNDQLAQKLLKNYTYVKTIGLDGPVVYEAGKTYTTFHYYIKDTEKQKIIYTVNYMDEKYKDDPTNEEVLAHSDVFNEDVDFRNTVKPVDIENYEYKDIKGMKTITGKGNNVIINLYYSKVEKKEASIAQATTGKLLIQYIDKDSKKVLSKKEKTAEVGTKYQEKAKAIKNYKLVKTTGKEKGSYQEGITKLTYYYQKIKSSNLSSNSNSNKKVNNTTSNKTSNTTTKDSTLPKTGTSYLYISIVTITLLSIAVLLKKVVISKQ
ncbi:MucBP domain-containing protein [Mycoplasma sp. P36-A1]|uniref:MucBP domain-containing protein n=1 Tax=Mycoplasma sp. P36-A1 TaxID=3252900 RepID=UPI003C2CE7F4